MENVSIGGGGGLGSSCTLFLLLKKVFLYVGGSACCFESGMLDMDEYGLASTVGEVVSSF